MIEEYEFEDDFNTPQFHWVAGFMSGTSIDAVDVALIYTNGLEIKEFGPTVERKYSLVERNILQTAVEAARNWNWEGDPPKTEFDRAIDVISRTHTDAFYQLVNKNNGNKPQLAGVHGQTVLHRAATEDEYGDTLQLVDAEALSKEFGISIVYDFRSMDIAAGGQGAPLTPAYHNGLFNTLEYKNGTVLNLGGVANITFIDRDRELIAFDTGPGNGPIDEWVQRHNRGFYDEGGQIARSGIVNQEKIDELVNNPWFKESPPKSLDRYSFSANMVDGLSFEDGVATLTAFSAKSVALGIELLPETPEVMIVCGGGRHNACLMDQLKDYVPCTVLTSEDVGWRGDSIEAEAFAYLAVRRLYGFATSWNSTTGVDDFACGGILHTKGEDDNFEFIDEAY